MDNISALKRQAELLLAKMEGKRYVVGDLNKRIQAAIEDHPQDTVIRAVASVMEQLNSKNPDQIISQADIEALYNELIGLNASGTKFREVFGDLLISELPNAVETKPEFINSIRDAGSNALEYNIDNDVKSGFDNLFEMAGNKYDPKAASLAKSKVGLELNSMGFGKSKISLSGGNSRFLVFTADLDTNRGEVRIFIPTESSGEKLPSTFIAGDKLQTLTAANVKNYIEAASNRNDSLPSVSAILNTLDIITGYGKKNVENDEFSKLASNLPNENGSEGLSSPGIFASIPDESKNVTNISIPKVPVPEPLKMIATDMEEGVIEASLGYPQVAVRLAKRMILTEFSAMGLKGSQVKIVAKTQDGFICEATLNSPTGKVNIEIPVEMNNNNPLMPSVFAKDDYVADFNAANIQSFLLKAATSFNGYAEIDSQLYSMGLAELKEAVVKAAVNKNFDICNEIMEIISKRADEETYRGIVSDYLKVLTNVKSAQEILEQAHIDKDQFVTTPNSMFPIHKKLGRPAHELVRDENGNYHLKSTYYAREEDEKAGAFFSTAKVLVGD